MNLTIRRRQPELMDQPGLDSCAHEEALAGLQRVNGISGMGRKFWREIDRVVVQRQLEGVRVLDLGCGGGDLAIRLAHLARRHGVKFSVDGYDISPTAVAYGNAQSLLAGAGNVQFFERDALNGSLDNKTDKEYDIVMCSLFLHHLDDHQAVILLRKMADAARHAVIIDDLQRTRIGYGLAWIGCRLLTRSRMVHVDGPLSVQGAFTVGEAMSLAERAGLRNARIAKHWPQRFLITWQPT